MSDETVGEVCTRPSPRRHSRLISRFSSRPAIASTHPPSSDLPEPPSPPPQYQAVPASQKGSWASFLKSIASFSGDLSSLTAPPFILSPISLTEFPELFAAIAEAKSEEDRSIAVLKWFISTLKGQYTSRNEKLGSEKKPLNPVLGELFYGYWPDTNNRGQTNLLVEQVSHHPPITAYHIANPTKHISLQGHNAQKTSFSGGSIIVKQIGHAVLTVELPEGNGKKEQFLITLPKLRIDGLWYGSPYVELCEFSYIQSSSGWLSTVEYKGKGYFSGKSHQIKAILTPPGSNNAKHTFEGLWHTTTKDLRTGATFTDVTGPKEEVTVASVEQQNEWESRRLWMNVAKGIREGDFEVAAREKSKIENEQRQRRRDEVAAGTKWELKHFEYLDSDPLYEDLGRLFKAIPPTEDAYVYRGNGPTLP
ncbi:Oxysterol binding protein [Steccherinum ochraceum]|uniref:Oxysterol binding protein n=1 Tax=Steccherinum ochraceum TaxID=92696 RepID=A0A4R0R5U4_9APHY|nr:Oxysterol binding protein [Steccherinum ochraceum]